MNRRRFLAHLAATTTAPCWGRAAAGRARDLGAVFEGVQAAFVVRDTRSGETVRHGPELAAARKAPWSTFKIWNTAIALDAGVVPDLSFRLDWDPTRRPSAAHWPDAWKKGHDVRSAFEASAVWFYQEVAERIGPERMRAKLVALRYGNADISSGIDGFWLNGSLRISADEQVDCLTNLLVGQVPFAPRTVGLVREVMVRERGPGWVFSGKTGAGPVSDGFDGWFVGTLEQDGASYAFATFMHAATWADLRYRRVAASKEALRQLGLWRP